jgi:hypothetical protein
VPKRPSKKHPEPPKVKVAQVKAPKASTGALPWLLLLLAGSGCAALIYEVVWFQLLQLVIGSSAISLGLLLAAYMGDYAWAASFCRDLSLREDTL